MQRKFVILLLAIEVVLSINGFAGEARRDAAFRQKSNAAQVAVSSGVATLAAQSQDMWLQAANRVIRRAGFQQGLFAVPAGAIAVAPNQPPVQPGSTNGIINALCDVPLYILGCGFSANAAVITCDTNGDGIPELQIPLKDVRVVNGNLIHVIIPALSPQLPGTAFPLACCGDAASLTLIQRVGAGDDNIFGEYTLKATCPIELGMRAPVILSAVASGGDCAIGHNLQLPGSCFILPDGTANVTSVFAVEKGNPGNVVEVTRFVILSDHLIDAYFEFGAANAGKRFLIYASGPNGTSRNMTVLPEGAPVGCPTGNEQGIEVAFTCASVAPPPVDPVPIDIAAVNGCQLDRTEAGVFRLIISGFNISANATVQIDGIVFPKVKFREPDSANPGRFTKVIVKGKVCRELPGAIVITNTGINGHSSIPLQCNQRCPN